MNKTLVVCAFALLAAVSASAKEKPNKKVKTFEPVVVKDVRSISGTYACLDRDFDVSFAVENGAIRGTLLDHGVKKALRNIKFDGTTLNADLVGGRFVNRIKNGETTFGFQLDYPSIRYTEQMILEHLFCSPIAAAPGK